jgi:YfiH family protein
MIRPPGFDGAAFGTARDGNGRDDATARRTISAGLGISTEWAFLSQVHGDRVVEAAAPGLLGEADGAFTTVAGLPLTVATADCVPLILEGAGVAAVVHAGWRGAAAGVLRRTRDAIAAAGHSLTRAAIGPAIGPCCYEVGDEVAALFPGFTTHTTWGTRSVDLPGYLAAQLADLTVWRSNVCTFTAGTLHSWRRDQTPHRQVAVAWLPSD